MKKLIVFSVIFALLVPAVFAADLGVAVFGAIRVLEGNSDADDITGSGGMTRLRVEGSGENGDGNFGAWYRFEGDEDNFGIEGWAWWKPIDQFKLTIGGNSDGPFNKEGVTGWNFYQMPSDIGIVNPGNVWGGGYSPWPAIFRSAFYGHSGNISGLLLNIDPMDVLGINIFVPFISMRGSEVGDIFKSTHAQVNLNLDFGEISVTYEGATGEGADQPSIYAYFHLSAIDNLGLDIGFGTQFNDPDSDAKNPIGIGLGVKYGVTDEFGFKARVLAHLGGESASGAKDPFILVPDFLPYYALSDNLVAFLGFGFPVTLPDEGDSTVGFYINPYLQVGAEWGPTFYAGFRLWTDGVGDDPTINWAVPIGVQVSF